MRGGPAKEPRYPMVVTAAIATGVGVFVRLRVAPRTVGGRSRRARVRRLVDDAPARHIQAAIMRENRSPAARAAVEAMREIGDRRARQLSGAATSAAARRGGPGSRRRPARP